MSIRLVVTLALGVFAYAAHAADAAHATPTRLRSADARAVCANFATVGGFVAANCTSTAYDTLDAQCLESFALFDAAPTLLAACEREEQDPAARQRMARFLEIYTAWQRHHTCELFHEKEARAARRCGGAAVQRPWREEAYPLYCDEIFALYQANRATLDAACARTPFSDAFWEAYADYVASPLCKTYYRHVRDATPRGCAHSVEAPDAESVEKCEAMFQWYTQHRDRVERECLEVQGAKPFYTGFYAWKHRHQPT